MKPQTKRNSKPATKPAPRKVRRQAVDPYDAVQELRTDLQDNFYELDTEIDLLLTALLCRGHVFLGGPPGTAKSALTRAVTGAITGAKGFRVLLTKFTLPEELFGVNSLQGIKAGTFERVTTGMLPEAHVALVDETFKASSAILNALLTIMEEREFRNGTTIMDCPLVTMVGASNETPESTELAALYDRFLLRTWTSYIADNEDFQAMILGGALSVKAKVALAMLEVAQAEVEDMILTTAAVQAVMDLKDRALVAGFSASDRRWKASIAALKAWAWLQGDGEVGPEHLDLYGYILWKEPKDISALQKLVGKVANPAAEAAQAALDACTEEYRKLPFTGYEARDPRQLFGELQDAARTFRDAIGKLEFDHGADNKAVVKATAEIERYTREAARLAAKVRGLL